MKNKLKNIYLALPTEKRRITTLVDSNERVTWIPLLPCGKAYNMGISERGFWTVEVASGLCELTEPRLYLYVMILLERSIDEIRIQLIQSLRMDIDIDSIFPFEEIIRMGLEQRDEYWVELAFNWYASLSEDQKQLFKKSLENLAESKRATQRLRQRAFKELRQLGMV